ncbi:hypothetical protein KSP40_PGU014654 [Platanthera guangdongensis]|uniref:Uncharacterized protein n=1 Tax=Platanthera guangdongensis TaxID=2320717 RepID=A0ABR2LQ42_9ASPA
MQSLPSSDSSKSFAMTPAGHRRHFLSPAVAHTLRRALFNAVRFLHHFLLLILVFFLLLLLLSATYSVYSNAFLTDYLPIIIAFFYGLVRFLRHIILAAFRFSELGLRAFRLSTNAFSFLKRRANRRTGLVVEPYRNGDVYEGELRRGMLHGSGVYYYCRGGMYEGEWINSKFDGHGVETWADGSKYKGQFKKGLSHGFGVYQDHAGVLYAGEWVNGQSHGYGMQTYEDGKAALLASTSWTQTWLRPFSVLEWGRPCRRIFFGKMHGFGVYRFSNGQRYEGAWRKGNRKGLGVCSSAYGEPQSGLWDDDFLEISSFAVNHTQVLEAVQAARTTAEKAYNIPRVDDMVNRAVAAAENAVNAAAAAGSMAVQTEERDHWVEYDFPMQMV